MNDEKDMKNKENIKNKKSSEFNQIKEVNNSEYKNENSNIGDINDKSLNNSVLNNKFYNGTKDEQVNVYYNGVHQGDNGNMNYNQGNGYNNGIYGDNLNNDYYQDQQGNVYQGNVYQGNVYHDNVYQGNNDNMNYSQGNGYNNRAYGDNNGYYQDEQGNVYQNGVYQGDNGNMNYNNRTGYNNEIFGENENSGYYQDQQSNVYYKGVYQGNVGDENNIEVKDYYNGMAGKNILQNYYQDNIYHEGESQGNNYNDNPNYLGEEKKKKGGVLIFILSFLISAGLIVLGYFGYMKFINKENIVDLSVYKVNFVAYGTESEGKPSVDILEIPKVDSKENENEIKKFLSEPDISFDKQSNLKNGDKVTVTIKLNKHTATKYNLKLSGDFKKTFTVTGLSNKQEVVVVKEKESNSSNKESNSNNTSRNDRVENNDVVTIIPEAGVNLRESASDNSKILKTVRKGMKVNRRYTEKVSSGEYWSYVEYDGVIGWMRSDLIG